MRKLETSNLEVYYPEAHRATALRIAARLEGCVARLRTLPVTQRDRGRAVILLTDSNLNNAYVSPLTVGLPQEMVLPHHLTLEVFNWFELGVAEIEDVSCHEAVHYVQLEQTDGFFGAINAVFGGIWQPNTFTESWFLEGLATYYEARLDKEVGRPNSLFWRGLFDSGVAEQRGELDPGYLNVAHRDALPFGGNYLVGQRFIEYLARTYGDDKLWSLIDVQGRSIASPLAVTLRFRSVYGKSIGAAFDDFRAELRKTVPRARPRSQEPLADNVGLLARMAGSPADSAIAVLGTWRDEPTRLTVFEADGSVRFTRRLTQVLPGRRWIEADPELTSGMSFTADGRWLYLVSADVASDGSFEAKLWQVDAHTGDVERTWDGLEGFGGSVSPDGKSYVFVELHEDTANLVRIDLDTGAHSRLTSFEGRVSLGAPAWGPDGRIVFSRWMGEGWDFWMLSPDGTLAAVTSDRGFNYAARWIDADHLLALGAHDKRWQVQRLTLSTRAVEWLSNVPYVALDPTPVGGRIALLNRVGWSWSLDTVPLPPVALAESPPEASASAPPPAAPAPAVLADSPYSSLDHLFIPSLHAPFFLIFPQQSASNPSRLTFNGIFAAASLMGSDRLGFHDWALNASYLSPNQQLQISGGYGNYTFAPWFTQLTLARLSDNFSRDLEATLSTTRSFWTSPVSFGLQALDRTNYEGCAMAGTCQEPGRQRFVGPMLAASYFATEATPYGGDQRGLGLSINASWFPTALGGTVEMADLGGELDAFVPLPFLKRHSLLVTARGRWLPGAPQGLLRVGGTAIGAAAWPVNGGPGNPRDASPIDLPQGVAFSETLRGYEDFALRATRAGIFGARYRVPWIIDWGTASTLYVLPSFFLRQVDFEVFGSDAVIDGNSGIYHRAAGGAVLVRTTFGQLIPATFYAQAAFRFDDGLAPLVVLGLALE